MQYLNLKTKAQLPKGAFCLQASSCCLKHSFFLSILKLYILVRMDWDGSHFLLKMWVSSFPITIYLENLSTSILKSNRVVVWRTMAQNTWRGMMQGEEMLDKISILHWMSLPNTPILCPTSVTNCRILSQEICFRRSQYYECSLLVNGWRHTVSLNSQMDCARLFDTLRSPWRQSWLLDKHDKWLAPIFQYKPRATNHLLVNKNAFARGQNIHLYTH